MKIKATHGKQGLPFEMHPEKYEEYNLVYTKKRGYAKEEYWIKKNSTGMSLEEVADRMGWDSFFGREIGIADVTLYTD